MKLKTTILSLLYVLLWGGAQADTYPGVVFDNSLVPKVYAKSLVTLEGSSWVENVNEHLPVSDTLFFTPGNALSMKYQSAMDGDWRVFIQYARKKLKYSVSDKEFLSVKLFVATEHTTARDLPLVSIVYKDGETEKLSLGDFVEDFSSSTWLDIRIPVRQFVGRNSEKAVAGIVFSQQGEGEHHIFVDQIEFLPGRYSKVRLSSPAVLSKVEGYDKHVQLQWQMPLTPSIRYVKIYRSEDNDHFEPVAIRPINMQGCLDFVPIHDKTYYYKIAWVDFDYKESPFSTVKEVKTRKLSDDSILNLVQLTNVNYFVENYDINSGMYTPFRTQGKVIVSTKETGLALMTMLIGVEREMMNRQIFVDRVQRIVKFLESAPQRFGVYATYYDGRLGNPIYLDGRAAYSVASTSSLMEGLLMVKAYLTEDSEAALRDSIAALWEKLEWANLLIPGSQVDLVSDVGIAEELNDIKPLSGLDESINAYILAAASKKYQMTQGVFEKQYFHSEDSLRVATDVSEILPDANENIEQVQEEVVEHLLTDREQLVDTLAQLSAVRDTTILGVRLPFGTLPKYSLLDVYRPFLTINPKTAKTKMYDFQDVLHRYTTYVKRRDNQYGYSVNQVDVWGAAIAQDSASTRRINPAISISAIAVDYPLGVQALTALYHDYGDRLFTEYGFRSWLDLKNDDVSDEYSATNQASVAVMIENARSGLIWNLYDAIPEIKAVKEIIFSENALQ